ncbi:hypothetical protein WJX72_007536 [[Myrmecia] bisecta]|uniref:Uncharacterized protein n=1 Tax=[Myrmecia] bisecta TaxID=41462 RepID=A0AAW1QFJ4_9CHLO
MQWDTTTGSDTWAVKEGWVSVTPLGLRSDIPFGKEQRLNPGIPAVLGGAVQLAANRCGCMQMQAMHNRGVQQAHGVVFDMRR